MDGCKKRPTALKTGTLGAPVFIIIIRRTVFKGKNGGSPKTVPPVSTVWLRFEKGRKTLFSLLQLVADLDSDAAPELRHLAATHLRDSDSAHLAVADEDRLVSDADPGIRLDHADGEQVALDLEVLDLDLPMA